MFKDIVQFCSSIPRLKILKFVLLQSEMRSTATAISATSGIQKNIVTQELQALKRRGVVISRRQGKNIFWSANFAHPFAPALRTFLEEVTIPNDTVIAKAFRGIPGIILVIAAGALARVLLRQAGPAA